MKTMKCPDIDEKAIEQFCIGKTIKAFHPYYSMGGDIRIDFTDGSFLIGDPGYEWTLYEAGEED